MAHFPGWGPPVAPPLSFNTDQGATNILETILGSPVPQFIPPNAYERQYIQVYQFFKPCIYYVYSALNNNFEEQIKKIMRRIIILLRNRNPNLLLGAIRVALMPPKEPADNNYQIGNDVQWTGANLNAYVDYWYHNIFVHGYNEDTALKLVIQGGEAVNRYTNFYDVNVPTHDCDTRILVGNHFNYLTRIGDVPDNIKQKMHIYRFLTLYGVISEVAHFYDQLVNHADTPQKVERRNNYRNQIAAFLPAAGITFCVSGNNGNTYEQRIEAETYSIDNDALLQELECVVVNVNGEDYTIVDTFLPYQRITLGHNDNLHSYFATAQAISVSQNGAAPIVEPGHVPHIPVGLTTGPLPHYGVRTFNIFIVPLGYILWDTMRMLLVSKRLQVVGDVHQKLEKYRQKFTVLISTLVNTVISSNIIGQMYASTSRIQAKNAILLGGGNGNSNTNTNSQTNSRRNTITSQTNTERKNKEANNTRAMSEPSMQTMPIEMLREAKALANKFRESEEYVSFDTIKTPVEFAAFMDYLHSIHGGWSDFRLPLLPEEKEKRKGITASKDMFKGYQEENEGPTKGGSKYRQTMKRKRRSARRTRYHK
jgi:hypothetical protein